MPWRYCILITVAIYVLWVAAGVVLNTPTGPRAPVIEAP